MFTCHGSGTTLFKASPYDFLQGRNILTPRRKYSPNERARVVYCVQTVRMLGWMMVSHGFNRQGVRPGESSTGTNCALGTIR